jgi:hypothetical protein
MSSQKSLGSVSYVSSVQPRARTHTRAALGGFVAGVGAALVAVILSGTLGFAQGGAAGALNSPTPMAETSVLRASEFRSDCDFSQTIRHYRFYADGTVENWVSVRRSVCGDEGVPLRSGHDSVPSRWQAARFEELRGVLSRALREARTRVLRERRVSPEERARRQLQNSLSIRLGDELVLDSSAASVGEGERLIQEVESYRP